MAWLASSAGNSAAEGVLGTNEKGSKQEGLGTKTRSRAFVPSFSLLL